MRAAGPGVERAGRLLGIVAGAGAVLLLVAAATVLVLQVDVNDAAGPARSCGSAFDVVSGRAGWETWRAEDVVDGSTTRAGTLLRTDRCPDVVNARILLAGMLTGAAVVMGAVAVVVVTRARATSRRRGTSARRRVRRLGILVGTLGLALTVGGLVTIVLVTADPNRTLFLYVDRVVVALIGLVLLVPVIALAIEGRALALFAAEDEDEDAGERREGA